MDREQLFAISENIRQAALKAARDSGVAEAWEGVGATVNLVGSVRSALIMKNLDIDFHIYTDEPMEEKSFAAIAGLEKNPGIKDIIFKDQLDTEEECLEWHAWYEDNKKRVWQLDMIHIRKGSAFDGAIERATDGVIAKLTPETREAILRIKYDAPDGVKTPGIEVYYAVLELGIKSYEDFEKWKVENPDTNLLGWIP